MPPAGFTALFNWKDLSGWWGAVTEDPRKWMALAPDALKKKHDDSLEDIHKHWSVANGELVNDGEGLYLTTDGNYRDIEFAGGLQDGAEGGQRYLPEGLSTGADLGPHRRVEVQRWLGQGVGRAVEQTRRGAPGQGPAGAGRQAVRRVEPFPQSRQLGSRTTVILNEKLVVDKRHPGKLF